MTLTADQAGTAAAPLALSVQAQDLLFREARTANTFTDEAVTDEQLQAIYDLVKWAPTSLNTQPLRIAAVRSAAARQTLVSHMSDGNKAKTEAAPLALVVTVHRDFHEHLPVLVPHLPGAKDMFADPDRRDAVGSFNAAIQLGYLILGIRAAGLAAGPMAGFDAAGIERALFPSGDQKVLAVVNVGHPGPDAHRPRAPRLAFDQVVTTI